MPRFDARARTRLAACASARGGRALESPDRPYRRTASLCGALRDRRTLGEDLDARLGEEIRLHCCGGFGVTQLYALSNQDIFNRRLSPN